MVVLPLIPADSAPLPLILLALIGSYPDNLVKPSKLLTTTPYTKHGTMKPIWQRKVLDLMDHAEKRVTAVKMK